MMNESNDQIFLNIYNTWQDYLFPSAQHLLIDIRSLVQFKHAPIPQAVHLPLQFRSVPTAAALADWKLDSPKRHLENYTELLQQIEAWQKTKHQLIFCCEDGQWKSPLLVHWLSVVFPHCIFLPGGYHTYKKALFNFLAQGRPYCLLLGKTGSGKTKVLQALTAAGEAVLDLEALAKHRGSVFGALNSQAQGSSPQLANALAQTLLTINQRTWIYVENKGKYLGHCQLPPVWLDQLAQSRTILLQVPREQRIQNILNDYQHLSKAYLQKALDKLKKRMSSDHYQACQKALSIADRTTLVGHLLDYYDAMSNYQHPQIDLEIDAKGQDYTAIARQIQRENAPFPPPKTYPIE